MGGAGNGVYDWDMLFYRYDADGKVDFRGTVYDDGDMVGLFYEGGALVSRREYDGDGSETWAGRETTYAADGSVVSDVYYETEADLPYDFNTFSFDLINELRPVIDAIRSATRSGQIARNRGKDFG